MKHASIILGTVLLAASAVAYSTAGFFTRLITVDAWTLLFWRGVFAGLFIFGLLGPMLELLDGLSGSGKK